MQKLPTSIPDTVRRSIESESNVPIKMTPEEALALKTACNMSDNQYQLVRNACLQHKADIFPTLHRIFEAKSKCYPENISFTETSAKCDLQELCNHTLTRVVSLADDVGDVSFDRTGTFFLKCGMDGASSQSIKM